jgi:transcriptional regulator with XRE-family HTH domain
MDLSYSRFVDSSTNHASEIATPCEQWLNSPMISDRDFRTAVGERLKRLRLALGRSQADIAKKLGVGATAVSNYENGTRAVDPYDAFKLKISYGAPLEWLYGGDESALPPHLAEKLDLPTKPRGVSQPAATTAPRRKATRRA